MARKKTPITKNSLYTEIFLLIFQNTNNSDFGRDKKNGILTREIKESIEKMNKQMFPNEKLKDKKLTSYTNKTIKMKKEGIISRADGPVITKKFKYIVNKDWVINTIFNLVNTGYKYNNIIKKSKKSYFYFQENILWLKVYNYFRELYKIDQNEIEKYKQLRTSSINEILEHFVYMEGFDFLDRLHTTKYKSPKNAYAMEFELNCFRYIVNKLIKNEIYLRNNSVYETICLGNIFSEANRKNRQEALQKSSILNDI